MQVRSFVSGEGKTHGQWLTEYLRIFRLLGGDQDTTFPTSTGSVASQSGKKLRQKAASAGHTFPRRPANRRSQKRSEAYVLEAIVYHSSFYSPFAPVEELLPPGYALSCFSNASPDPLHASLVLILEPSNYLPIRVHQETHRNRTISHTTKQKLAKAKSPEFDQVWADKNGKVKVAFFRPYPRSASSITGSPETSCICGDRS